MASVTAWNVAAPGSVPARVAAYQRRRMFAAFMAAMEPGPFDTVLDVGVTSDVSHDHSNYFEAWYPWPRQIVAAGQEDATAAVGRFGVGFRFADACALPFEARRFDFVHAGAVLEHVGSRERQVRMLAEAWRVANKGVFITTPNRWFPVEVHTVLPLVHWLPAPVFRGVLRALGHEFFADEANLNLIGGRELLVLARQARWREPQLLRVRLGGWCSNLVLYGRNA